jgi:hypothetical protein
MKLISGPAIAALRMRTRMAENLAMRRGEYGPSFALAGVRYVALDGVERRAALKFSDEQLKAAAGGLPGRILTFEEAADAA